MADLETLVGQADAIAAGEISPVDLVDDVLGRIARVQEATNAFTHVLADRARERAEQLAQSSDVRRGPLFGVPVAVKELYDVEGVPTTGCCAAYADRIAAGNARVVERLEHAGAIVVAKTNQHELAVGGTGLDSSFGAVRNPWDPHTVPGGSSSGSGVAVATRAVAMAMGSDTAGSIRHPASFCGVTGLKTTFGAVSRRGAMPLAPTLDTMGPIAAAANDCAVTFSVIHGFDAIDPWSRRGVPTTQARKRIALPKTFFDRVHPETRAAVEAAARVFEKLGARVEEIDGPEVESARRALGAIFVCELADRYRDLWDDDRVGAGVRTLLSIGRNWLGADLASAHATTARIKRDFDEVFQGFDAMLAPSTPYPAQRTDATEVDVGQDQTVPHTDLEFARLSMPVNLTGVPAVAFPIGFDKNGMPLGAQLVGPHWSDLALCDAVADYQSETDWHTRRPPGF